MAGINFYLDKYFGLEIISCRPKEAIKFAKKYFKDKKITAIEIGVLRGQNSKDIINSLNINRIYLIDPFEKYKDYENDGNYKNVKIAEKQALKRLKKYQDRIYWIKEYSENAINKLKEKVNFIYIDGNHEYEYVKKDLELYWNILKDKGIISGHDIQYKGVSDAVLEFAKKKKLKVHFGDRRDWWIIKK